MERQFFVYILASLSRTLYTGVTRDLLRRVYEHREGLVEGFTKRYRVTRLVYFEQTLSAFAIRQGATGEALASREEDSTDRVH